MLFSVLAILRRAAIDLRRLAVNATRVAEAATARADVLGEMIAKLTEEPDAVVVGEIVTTEPTEQRPT